MQNIQKYAPDAENSMNYVTPENVSSVSELDSIEAFIEVRKNENSDSINGNYIGIKL